MSQISRLVAEITEKARIIDAELERSKQVLPNDDVWSQLEFPNLGPQAAVARGELLSLIHQLDKTIQSPVEYFRNLSQATLETACIHTLIGFNIPSMIRLDESVSYEDLSQQSGLGVKALKTMVRASALATNFLVEEEETRVAHTALSSIFHPDRNETDRAMAARWQFTTMLQCGANLQKALERDPTAQDDHASAWALAFAAPGEKKPANFWGYLEREEDMKKNFHAAMRIATKYPMRDIQHLVHGYDWSKLHCGTVVELGGSTGQISTAIAEANPCITFYVQDLPEVIDEATKTVTPPKNVHFERASFFEPQPRVANAYLFRTILHDWSDTHVRAILSALLPSLRPGSRVIVEDIVLPPHKTVPHFKERMLRRADAIMMNLFNGRERPLEDFRELFRQVDGRFGFKGCHNPRGSVLSIMEWVWEGQEEEEKKKVNGVVPGLQEALPVPMGQQDVVPQAQDIMVN